MSRSTAQAPAPPRPMRADARRNYERLLREARTSFAERGTDASLEDIARRGFVNRRFLHDRGSFGAQRVARVRQMLLAIAEIRAEPQIYGLQNRLF